MGVDSLAEAEVVLEVLLADCTVKNQRGTSISCAAQYGRASTASGKQLPRPPTPGILCISFS